MVLITFDITDALSFERIDSYWLDSISDINQDPRVIKVIVGNKCDLEAKRQIDYVTARDYCR